MSDSAWLDLRKKMVEEIAARGVADERVIAAMLKIPRHIFVPEDSRADAYEDKPVVIGQGQTISQPYITALMTEALEVKCGHKILEAGTGSGYQAALLCELGAELYSIEFLPELSRLAAENLKKAGYAPAQLKTGDGYAGWKECAPFDGIIVTCAPPKLPPALAGQLKEGGRMVVPIGAEGQVQELFIMKKRNGQMETERTLPVRFVPMRGAAEKAPS